MRCWADGSPASTNPAWETPHIWVDLKMPTEGALITEALHDALNVAKIESFHEATYFEEI